MFSSGIHHPTICLAGNADSPSRRSEEPRSFADEVRVANGNHLVCSAVIATLIGFVLPFVLWYFIPVSLLLDVVSLYLISRLPLSRARFTIVNLLACVVTAVFNVAHLVCMLALTVVLFVL